MSSLGDIGLYSLAMGDFRVFGPWLRSDWSDFEVDAGVDKGWFLRFQ